MPLLDMDLDNVIAPRILEEGEANLRVIGVEEGQSKKTGEDYLRIRLDPFEEVGANEIAVYLMLPNANNDAKTSNKRRYRIKEFMDAIGATSMDTDHWLGETCWAILGVQTSEEYGDQNTVKRFIVR